MQIGTFPRTESKAIGEQKDYPDWHSGPDAMAADEIGVLKRWISETPTTLTVEYEKEKRPRLEILREKRKAGRSLTLEEQAEVLDILLGV